MAGVFYLAFAGVVCVYGVTVHLGVPFNASMGLTIGAAVLGIYILNRVSDIREDFVNQSGAGLFARQERLFLFLGSGLLVFVLLLNRSSGELTLYLLVLIMVGVGYSFPIVPWLRNWRINFVRIKQIPFAKTITVAVFWGMTVFVVPAALSPDRIEIPIAALVVLLIGLSLATFSNTLFSDIRDTAGDRLAGNDTIPVICGERTAYSIVFGANALLIVLGIVSWYAGIVGVYEALLVSLMGPFSLVYLSAHWWGTPEWLVEMLSDSHFLVYGLGLMLIS